MRDSPERRAFTTLWRKTMCIILVASVFTNMLLFILWREEATDARHWKETSWRYMELWDRNVLHKGD
jgi:cytochrome c oxidase assembly factor CtaG